MGAPVFGTGVGRPGTSGRIGSDDWEINGRAKRLVQVIGQGIERDMGDDLDDIAVGVSGMAQSPHISVLDLPAFIHQLDGELHRNIGLAVQRLPASVGEDFIRIQLGAVASKIAMRRNAIAAAIGLCDCQGDPLSRRWMTPPGGLEVSAVILPSSKAVEFTEMMWPDW